MSTFIDNFKNTNFFFTFYEKRFIIISNLKTRGFMRKR